MLDGEVASELIEEEAWPDPGTVSAEYRSSTEALKSRCHFADGADRSM
jgi:hypothetical protein